jgi:GT2 family glycosyltransferase
MTEPAVDVVITTRDQRGLVLECLEHLGDPMIASVVVVDNASSDGTAQAVRTAHRDVSVVRLNARSGLATANNRGAEHGMAELLLFLNDDVVPAQGAISMVARTLLSSPEAVAAGGRLVDAVTGRTQPNYRPRTLPTLRVFASEILMLERMWPRNRLTRRHWGANLDDRSTVEVEHPCGACLMVRRDAFAAVGGYDERYWFWHEDADLVRRLTARGRALWVPSAVFRHHGARSLGRWPPSEVVRSRYQSVFTYGRAHFSRRGQFGLAIVTLLAALPRIAAFSIGRPESRRAYQAIARGSIALLRGRAVPDLILGRHVGSPRPSPGSTTARGVGAIAPASQGVDARGDANP